MSKQEIRAAGATAPQGAYSQAIRAGDFLFVSGEGPMDEQGQVTGDTVEDQTHLTMINLGRVLDAAGATFADVVKATAFLRTIDDYEGFNSTYGQFFPRPFPARVCVAAAGLYAGILVEVDLVAYVPDVRDAARSE